MTMRAILGMPTGDDPLPGPDAAPKGLLGKLFGVRPKPHFRGVYLHNAGWPSDVAPLLYNVVQLRHGGDVEKAWRELLLDNPAGWSSLGFFWDEQRCRVWDGSTKVSIETHQNNFNDDQPDPGPCTYQGDPQRDLGFKEPPISLHSDKMGAVSVWILCRSELVLFLVEQDGTSVREWRRFRWSEQPDWEGVDSELRSEWE